MQDGENVELQRGNNGKTLGGVTGKGFLPGQSGNPGGRPKGSVKVSTCYERAFARLVPDDPLGRTYAQLMADTVVEKAAKGDIDATREATDRHEGKAKQTVNVGGPEQLPDAEVDQAIVNNGPAIIEMLVVSNQRLSLFLTQKNIELTELLAAAEPEDIKLLNAVI